MSHNERTINDWLNAINKLHRQSPSALDFPLHYALKGLCDTYEFSLTNLA
jgi:hypothetical protein